MKIVWKEEKIPGKWEVGQEVLILTIKWERTRMQPDIPNFKSLSKLVSEKIYCNIRIDASNLIKYEEKFL